jgi:hypothetical protein
MKFTIPPPLGLRTQRIDVLAVPPAPPTAFGGLPGQGRSCASFHERSAVLADVVTAGSARWIAWAVGEALAGRTPRTRAFLSPVLSGGPSFDLGRGPVARPMVFAGATCAPERDGQMCDHPAHDVPPPHEALMPARRVVVEEVGDIILDDFDEGLSWPLVVVDGGSA